jgi:hypothetical protein
MTTLTVDQHCDMLTAHMRDCTASIMDGFKLYIQLFSALVGGARALRLQYGSAQLSPFLLLSDVRAAVIFAMSAIIIVANLVDWFDFRTTLSKVAGKRSSGEFVIPLPTFWDATKIEIAMLLAMAVSLGLFLAFNPVRG